MPLLQPGSRSFAWQVRNARGVASVASLLAGEAIEQVGAVTTGLATVGEAVDTAVAAADTAVAAADTAVENTGKLATFQAVRDSYSDSGSVTASDDGATAKITVAAHNRNYLDGTVVGLGGGSVAGLAFSTDYFISYLDPTLAGGAVTYEAFTTIGDAMNTIDVPGRHFVDAVKTPADGSPPASGGGGYGDPWWKRPGNAAEV